MQVYLDCDGVLADFDRAAIQLLGMPPREYEKRHGKGPSGANWPGIPISTDHCR